MTPSAATIDALAKFAKSFPVEAAWMLAVCISEADVDDTTAQAAERTWRRFRRQYTAPADSPGVIVRVPRDEG